MNKIYPVIMCGGAGTRLWPLSRASYPKQFLKLISDYSMLQETALRVKESAHFNAPTVVSHQDYRFLVGQQLSEAGIQARNIILEPEGKNTAAAVAVASLSLMQHDSDAVLLVLPSDHYIKDVDAFMASIKKAYEAAAEGKIVTFGIIPEYPEPGYGYIQAEIREDMNAVKSQQFIEKPSSERAAKMIQDGGWLWNSGMFMFRASIMIDEIKSLNPDIISLCQASLSASYADADFMRLGSDSYLRLPHISLDKAVMEKTSKSWVVPVSMGWSDVGSFKALADILPQDESQNVLQGNVKAVRVNNSFIRSDGQLITAIDVENTIVIGTRDAILVANRKVGDDLRLLVGELKEANTIQASDHAVTHRPWGKFETIQESVNSATEGGYRVKRITVYPNGRLSLQKHQYRAEHWIVVKGTAEVTCDDSVFTLEEGQSTFIPLGAVHRLANLGKEDLEIIEVQVGSRCAEDDIIRLEDIYGRSQKASG